MRLVLLVLGIVFGLFALGALACCGVGYYGVTVFQSELSKQFRQQIEDSPEIAEHIGQIESLQMRFIDSAASGDDDEMIFDISGSKGSGQVMVDVSAASSSQPEGAFVLVLDDGTRLPLTGVKESTGEFDADFDFNMDLDLGDPTDESPADPPAAPGPEAAPDIDLGDPAQHRSAPPHAFSSLPPFSPGFFIA